jgi:arginine deiminase
LAKYWTADFAVQTAKWAMEVHGGIGTLQEFRVERWLREAMILAIWEGPAHRQILDALEVMERKRAHRLLFEWIKASGREVEELTKTIEEHLALPQRDKEAGAEAIIRDLTRLTAKSLLAMESQ